MKEACVLGTHMYGGDEVLQVYKRLVMGEGGLCSRYTHVLRRQGTAGV